MDWIDRLAKIYGRYAIVDLMKYLIIGCGTFFVLASFEYTSFLMDWMVLNPSEVLKGQIWRLVTFVFVPDTLNPIFMIFALFLLGMFGRALEDLWGSFRLNVYYLLGIAFAIVSAFISGASSAQFINLSVFLAFAYLNPNFELMIFFVLPVKVKYIAYLNVFFIAYTILFAPFLSIKLAACLSLGNFFVFFGKDIYYTYLKAKILPKLSSYGKQTKTIISSKNRKGSDLGRKDFNHVCSTCGRNSKQYPELKFGYCITCGSDYTYCQEHLMNHTHASH